MKQKNIKTIAKIFGAFLLIVLGLWGTFVLAEQNKTESQDTVKTPIVEQSSFRFFLQDGTDKNLKPTTRQNQAVDLPKSGAHFNLKMLLGVSNADFKKDEGNFKLQYAEKVGECDSKFVGEDYSDVTSDTAIAYIKNAKFSNGELLPVTKYDPINKSSAIRNQSFVSKDSFSNNVSGIASGESGKWEFSLRDNSIENSTSYCLRAVKSNGDLLENYSSIPEVTTEVPVLVDLVDARSKKDESQKDLFPAVVITDTKGYINRQGGIKLSLQGSQIDSAWSESDTKIDFAGSAKDKASKNIRFLDTGKTIFIPLDEDLQEGDRLVISGLRFINLSSETDVEFLKKDFVMKDGTSTIYFDISPRVSANEVQEEIYTPEYSKEDLEKIPTHKVSPDEFFDKANKDNFTKDESVSFSVSNDITVVKDDANKIPDTGQSVASDSQNLISNFFKKDESKKNENTATSSSPSKDDEVSLPKDGPIDIVSVEVLDHYDLPTDLNAKVVDENGESKIEVVKPSDSFRPGNYKLKTTVIKDGVAYEIEKDFTWGVLAINTDKDRYEVGDSAYLQFASLDEYGHTLCDTDLKLTILKPNGSETILSTENGDILYSSETCGHDNYTLDPDYFANYVFAQKGTYKLHLENTKNNFSIDQDVSVFASTNFVVKRKSATRTNPFLNQSYRMDLEIYSSRSFDGKIVETLPQGFTVAESLDQGFTISENEDGSTSITWDTHLSSSEPTTLYYDYYGPQISPEFFNLGPLVISEYKKGIPEVVYTEDSSWQIASDASCVSAGTGNWTAITWTNCASGPQSGDTVTIREGDSVTLNAAKTIAGLTICDSACATNTTLTHGSLQGLTINGGVTVNGGNGGTLKGIWDIATGSSTVSGSISYNPQSTNAGRTAQISISTGYLAANGGIAFENTAGSEDNQLLIISSTGGVKLKGAITNQTVADIQPGTTSYFNYYDTTAQTIVYDSTNSTYNDLQINNTGGATLGAAMSATNVTGNVSVQSGTLLNGGFNIVGTSGKTFSVSASAIFTMTGTGLTGVFPSGFSTYTFDSASTVNYNQDSAPTISAQTYGILNLTPTLTSTRIYTGSAFTTAGNFTINPTSASAGRSLSVAMNGDITVAATATTTISGTGAGPATSVLDTRPISTDYNLSTGHLDIQTNGTLDATSAASNITLTGTDTSGILFTRTGTFTAGNTTVIMNPNATVNLTSGTFIGSNAFYKLQLTPTLSSSGKTYTFGSGVASTTSNFDINPTASSALALTVNMGADIDVAATATTTIKGTTSGTSVLDVRPSSTDYNLQTGHLDIQSAGTLDATSAASTITLKGTDTSGILFTRTGTFTAGNSTVVMNPNASVTLTSGTFIGTNAFYKLQLTPTLASSGKTYTFGSGVASTTSNFDINPTAGSALALTVNMGADIDVASTATTTITKTTSATSLLDTRPVSNDYNLSSGHLDIESGGTLDAGSSASVITLNATDGTLFTQNGAFTTGSSVTKITSTSGTPRILSTATTLYDLTIDSSATVINVGAGAVSIGRNLSITTGVLNSDSRITGPGAGSGTLTVSAGAKLCLGGTTDATNSTCDSGAAQTAIRNLPTFQSYSFDSASTVRYLTDVDQTISAQTYGILEVAPTLTAARTYTGSAFTTGGNFTINPQAASTNRGLLFNLNGNITLGSTGTTTITGSGAGPATSTIDVRPSSSDYNITAGSIDIQTNGKLDAASSASTITVNGNWTKTGTFTQGNSTVSLAGSGTQKIFSSTTFYNLSAITTSARALTFTAGTTQTIASGGSATLTGASGQLLTLQSGTASSDWNFSIPSGSSRTINYTAGIDANATDSAVYPTNSTCTRTTNWDCLGANQAPVLSNMTLNGGNNITLVESSYKWATTSFLVTDEHYCSSISSVSAKMYLASTTPNYGTLCSADDSNCYSTAQACVATTTGNTCGASDTTVEYDCGFKVWYIARATDSGSAWASSVWSAAATATDSGSLSGTATSSTPSSGIEVNTLRAIDFSEPTINYGSLAPNSDTGAVNQSIRVVDTGNVDSDLEVSGTEMICGACSISTPIPIRMQQFFASVFTYGGGTMLTDTPQNFDVNLSAPNSTTTSSYIYTYWGLGVGDAAAGVYTGTNTISPIAPF